MDEREQIRQHHRYVELYSAAIAGFSIQHKETITVHTVYFSVDEWPSEELFDEIPAYAGFGIEYNEKTKELRVDAPSLIDLVEICMSPSFPMNAKPIMQRSTEDKGNKIA